jgi:hypothetical protein
MIRNDVSRQTFYERGIINPEEFIETDTAAVSIVFELMIRRRDRVDNESGVDDVEICTDNLYNCVLANLDKIYLNDIDSIIFIKQSYTTHDQITTIKSDNNQITYRQIYNAFQSVVNENFRCEEIILIGKSKRQRVYYTRWEN